MKKNSFFTLVELLIVIGIIIILAGILLPVTSGALKKADQTKALSMAKVLENAFKMYRNDYGYYPSDDSGNVTSGKYDDVIKALQGDNQKKTRYLEIQGNEKGLYKDPWDQPFEIYFDSSYGGEFTLTNGMPGVYKKNGDTKYIKTFYYSVVVYSKGPDGLAYDDSSTKSQEERNKANADNVYSFPTVLTKTDKGKIHVISK